jgi:hypothetical protein
LIYRFSMVFCTKLDWAGPGEEGAEESVSFAYGALQVVYHLWTARRERRSECHDVQLESGREHRPISGHGSREQ